MRIASNSFLPKAVLTGAETAFLVVLGVCSLAPCANAGVPVVPSVASPAVPSIVAPTVSAQAAAPVATTASQQPSVGVAPASATPTQTPPQGAIPSSFQVPEPSKAQGEDIAKNLSTMEDKVTENAKSIVKHLDSSEATSLSDLNSARQTITRIEAMIDVEKRLGELEKLRNDRNSRSFAATSLPSSLASAIPASALQPGARPNALPPLPSPQSSFSSGEQPIMHMGGAGRAEITRIVGTEGKYVAVLKLPDGDTKSVKVGEKIPGQGTVRAITSSSVEVGEKGTSHTLHIKNVDAIYSAMR